MIRALCPRSRGEAVIAILFLLTAPVIAFGANGTFLLLIVALAGQSRHSLRHAADLARRHWPIPGLLSGLLVWAGLSALWSPDDRVLTVVALRFLIALGGWLLLALVLSQGEAARLRLRRVALAGGLLLLAILAIEAATGGAMTGLLRDGNPVNPAGSQGSARGTALLALFIWPLALTAGRMAPGDPGRTAPLLAAAVWLAGFAVIWALPMEASHTGLLAGVVAVLACRLWRRRALTALMLLALGGLMSGAWLARPVIDSPAVREATAIPLSWRHRLLVWDNTSALLRERPLVGHGLRAARHIAGTTPLRLAGDTWRPVDLMPLHPHNVALEIWFELGLVGLVLALGLPGLLAMPGRFMGAAVAGTGKSRLAGLAMTGAFFTWLFIAAVGFGTWQGWWQAGLWLAVALLALVCAPPGYLAGREPVADAAVGRDGVTQRDRGRI